MKFLFEKLIKKKKIINIRRKRKKVKKRRYIAQKQNSEKAVFVIKRSFIIAKNSAIICGKVKSGSFKTRDNVEIFDMQKNYVKLQAKIKKITTTLVEVNKISSGFETDMLIDIVNDMGKEILPGDIAVKL